MESSPSHPDIGLLNMAVPAGTLDSSFGSGGKLIIDATTTVTLFPGVTQTRAFAPIASLVQTDGKTIAIGSAIFGGNFELKRYNPDGSIDPNFGTAGSLATNLSELSVRNNKAMAKFWYWAKQASVPVILSSPGTIAMVVSMLISVLMARSQLM
jgi:hypothetical protein